MVGMHFSSTTRTHVLDYPVSLSPQVESNLPAAMGGVQLGWRVNAVNGEDVRGEQEAVVKALLKQANDASVCFCHNKRVTGLEG
eukprot:1405108-Pleurochrysis_carterae.AAC.2